MTTLEVSKSESPTMEEVIKGLKLEVPNHFTDFEVDLSKNIDVRLRTLIGGKLSDDIVFPMDLGSLFVSRSLVRKEIDKTDEIKDKDGFYRSWRDVVSYLRFLSLVLEEEDPKFRDYVHQFIDTNGLRNEVLSDEEDDELTVEGRVDKLLNEILGSFLCSDDPINMTECWLYDQIVDDWIEDWNYISEILILNYLPMDEISVQRFLDKPSLELTMIQYYSMKKGTELRDLLKNGVVFSSVSEFERGRYV